MLFERLSLMKDLLAENGSIFVNLDYHVGYYSKNIMNEIFGESNFRNEIIWQRTNAHASLDRFGPIHDTIYYYAKEGKPIYNDIRIDYNKDYLEMFVDRVDANGKRFMRVPLTAKGTRNGATGLPFRGIDITAKGLYWKYKVSKLDELDKAGKIYWPKKEDGMPRLIVYEDELPGMPLQDIWTDVRAIHNMSQERLGFETQKPEALLERIIKAGSEEKSLIADLFCGSGTTLSVAEKLGRRWIGCDLGRFAIHTTRKRLLEIEDCKPFEILNLGKYERQYWQGVTFGAKGKTITEQALYEYLAFILKLYDAQPLAGLTHLHGKKGKALVHIGAVDAPVTIDEINAALEECLHLKQKELHVLAWEWEMGLNDLMVSEAKKRGVKLLLLQIPREAMEQQAVDKGDIQFFELAYLEVEIKSPKKLVVQVTLKDFVILNTELIPDEVRAKVKKWSDYIDYWAVDWDFQNDTFMQGWVTYRTRKDRTLALTSDLHTYGKPGRYQILVKVIDIFGNDTSQAFEVEAK